MKNKQREFIIRAFLESKIPEVIMHDAPNLVLLDSMLGGYCVRALRGDSCTDFKHVIGSEDKKIFSDLINHCDGEKKKELVVYYRLAILTEDVLIQR